MTKDDLKKEIEALRARVAEYASDHAKTLESFRRTEQMLLSLKNSHDFANAQLQKLEELAARYFPETAETPTSNGDQPPQQ